MRTSHKTPHFVAHFVKNVAQVHGFMHEEAQMEGRVDAQAYPFVCF